MRMAQESNDGEQTPRVWVWRTSYDDREYLFREVMAGRLRQGWGVEGLTLRTGSGDPVDVEQWAAQYAKVSIEVWKEGIDRESAIRRQRILARMLEIVPGDLIVLPNLPDWERFSIAKVVAAYRFDEEANTPGGDFRHIVEVGPLVVVTKKSSLDANRVLRGFRSRLSAINSVWDQDVIEAVVRLAGRGQQDATKKSAAALCAETKSVALAQFATALARDFLPNDLEQLVKVAFERAGYEFVRANHYDGKGGDADLVFNWPLPVVGTLSVFVQVKKKSGHDAEAREGVAQLIAISKDSPGSLRVLVNTADRIDDDARDLAAENGVVLLIGQDAVEFIMDGVSSALGV